MADGWGVKVFFFVGEGLGVSVWVVVGVGLAVLVELGAGVAVKLGSGEAVAVGVGEGANAVQPARLAARIMLVSVAISFRIELMGFIWPPFDEHSDISGKAIRPLIDAQVFGLFLQRGGVLLEPGSGQ